MAFIPPKVVEVVPEEAPKYDHGYSEEEVIRITNAIKVLEARDKVAEPVTFEEFKNYVVPYFRIIRTEEFKLKEAKPKAQRKVKEPKEVKPKTPKKLSKKAIQEELTRLIFKMATGTEFTPEEQEFYKQYTGG